MNFINLFKLFVSHIQHSCHSLARCSISNETILLLCSDGDGTCFGTDITTIETQNVHAMSFSSSPPHARSADNVSAFRMQNRNRQKFYLNKLKKDERRIGSQPYSRNTVLRSRTQDACRARSTASTIVNDERLLQVIWFTWFTQK